MSIISVKERRMRDAGRNDTSEEDSRHFVVVSDDPNEDPRAVSIAEDPNGGVAVPRYGEQRSPTSPLIVNDKRLTRSESAPKVWYIECRYGLPGESQRTEQSNQQDLPELEAPVVRVYSETVERTQGHWWRQATEGEQAGQWFKQAARNTAGCRLPEGFVGMEKNPIVEFQRNISADTNVILRKMNLDGTYCRDSVFGVPLPDVVPPADPNTPRNPNQRRARMLDMVYQKFFRFKRTIDEEELIQEYWQETLTIGFYRPVAILNQGDRWRDDDGVIHAFADEGRDRVGLLNATGGPLGGFDANGNAKGFADDANPAVFLDNVLESKPIQWEPTLELPATLNEVQAILFFPIR